MVLVKQDRKSHSIRVNPFVEFYFQAFDFVEHLSMCICAFFEKAENVDIFFSDNRIVFLLYAVIFPLIGLAREKRNLFIFLGGPTVQCPGLDHARYGKKIYILLFLNCRRGTFNHLRLENANQQHLLVIFGVQ